MPIHAHNAHTMSHGRHHTPPRSTPRHTTPRRLCPRPPWHNGPWPITSPWLAMNPTHPIPSGLACPPTRLPHHKLRGRTHHPRLPLHCTPPALCLPTYHLLYIHILASPSHLLSSSSYSFSSSPTNQNQTYHYSFNVFLLLHLARASVHGQATPTSLCYVKVALVRSSLR